MKKTEIEFHRRNFEKIDGEHLIGSDGNYVSMFDKARFEGYLMAFENEEIELPKPIEFRVDESTSDYEERHIHNNLLLKVKKSIESRGLKVKSC